MKEKYWVIERENISAESKESANRFLEDLKLSGKSENTIDKYRRVLEKFLSETTKNLKDLVPDDVLGWLNTNYGDKKERTYDLHLSTLASYFKYCLAEGYIDRNLVKNRWRPRIPKSLPRFLNGHEVARVKLHSEGRSLRDRAILSFFLSSGCRSAEVVNLKKEDIDLRNRTAIVKGKGNKYREVHFSEETALLLTRYLKDHPRDIPNLFLNKNGNPFTKSGIYNLIRKMGEEAGLSSNLSPHCLRHTFATSMLARGNAVRLSIE